MKLVGILACGTYYSPWTPYTIASIYNHIDELIIVNGGFDLNNPQKEKYTIPLQRVTDYIQELDINKKITEVNNFTINDLKYQFKVARQSDQLNEMWYDQRGLNLSLAHQIAIDRGADIILKIDSDQVCYSDVKKVRNYNVGQIFYQYEFIKTTQYLSSPNYPFNDSVFTYQAAEGWYGGGGAPGINAIRQLCHDIHCAHLRYANPLYSSKSDQFNHFFGRSWFAKMTNEGLWGKELEEAALNTTKSLLTRKGVPTEIYPPEVTLYQRPIQYIVEGK